MARTLIATALYSSKGKPVYCTSKKVTDEQLKIIKNTPREELEEIGFTFINLNSYDYPNIRGYAIFFEGHMDEMGRTLKGLKN